MHLALEPGANFVSQPNAWQHRDASVMVHHKPSILHLHETTVRERGEIQLHNCFVILYHTFNYLMCSPLNKWNEHSSHLITMLIWYFSIHWNEWMTAQGTAASRPRQAPQNKLTLVSHWISFSFLSRASALCLSSSLCLASVAASMSLIFKLKVTSFQRLKKRSEGAEYLVERGVSNLKMKG